MWKLRIGALMISAVLGLGASLGTATGSARQLPHATRLVAHKPLAQPVVALNMAVNARLTRHKRQVRERRHRALRHAHSRHHAELPRRGS